MNIEKKLKEMSIEQKAALCVGMNFWMTREYPDLGIPSLFLSDGPHGLRKQDVNASDHLGINESHQSVCYPTACTTACSWDRDLMFRMGSMLGREAAQSGVDILLGPGINIKRSPLCGRNFEYFSEDPYLAGQLAASFVRGIQSAPVSACVKHFAANSQENRRKAISAIMDERTLREIYLPAFEAVVRLGDVDAVMTSYNKINGEYPAQNKHVSSDILRDEWGFDGAVITDYCDHHSYMNGDQALRAGGSLWMSGMMGGQLSCETGSNSYLQALRRAAKQTLYMYLHVRVTNRDYAESIGDTTALRHDFKPAVLGWRHLVALIDLVAVALFALAIRGIVRDVKLYKAAKAARTENKNA